MNLIFQKKILLFFISTVFILQSCLKEEYENIKASNDTILPGSYKGFEFKTTTEVELNVVVLNSSNKPVSNALTEIYLENPLDDQGLFVQPVINEKVFHGITNQEGAVSCFINHPVHADSLFIHVRHIGVPTLTKVALNQAKIDITIGGNTQLKNTGKPDNRSLSYQFKTTPTIVNGYYTLGTWDVNGVPDYLEPENDLITSDFLADVNASLPERVGLPVSHPQYLSGTDDVNLDIIENCEIWVTFVHEGAGWRNSLAYFTYPTDTPPETTDDIINPTIIYPNVSYAGSGGGLMSGNKVQLQYLDPETNEYTPTFPPGVTVGWILIAQGWFGSGVVGNGYYKNYSNTDFNLESDPDLRRHNVLLYDEARDLFLLGFEDIRRDRFSDEDFNDAVFYATLSPSTAVNRSIYQPMDNPTDSDSDNVSDVFDDYPNDAEKAFDNFYPAQDKMGTLVFEDLWPYKGDYDFNDLVIDYNFNQVTNAENKVTAIVTQVVVRAIGASYHNAFGISLNTLPGNVESVSGQLITKDYLNLASNGTEEGQSKAVVIFFDDAFNALPYPGTGICVNTYPQYPYVTPDTFLVTINFTEPINFSDIGTPPYNPFIIIDQNRDVEVHLPNLPPTDLADTELLGTGHDDSDVTIEKYYVSDIYLPWAINLPESFDYPAEKEDITQTHLVFDKWATSLGFNYMDWYMDKAGYRDNTKIYNKE